MSQRPFCPSNPNSRERSSGEGTWSTDLAPRQNHPIRTIPARAVALATQNQLEKETKMKRSVWVVGLLAALMILPACSKKEEKSKAPAAASQQQAQPASPAATAGTMAANDMAQGEKVYNQTCKACHETGVAGAPKFGDKAAWADRIAQGMDTLEKNSINGFTGKTGTMPPKGGNAALSDDEVKAAVEYMVSNSK